MKLNIINQEKKVFEKDVVSATLPALAGELTVMDDHIPLITPLKKGRIMVKDSEDKKFYFDIERGILEVQPKETTVLVTGEVFLFCQADEMEK